MMSACGNAMNYNNKSLANDKLLNKIAALLAKSSTLNCPNAMALNISPFAQPSKNSVDKNRLSNEDLSWIDCGTFRDLKLLAVVASQQDPCTTTVKNQSTEATQNKSSTNN